MGIRVGLRPGAAVSLLKVKCLMFGVLKEKRGRTAAGTLEDCLFMTFI